MLDPEAWSVIAEKLGIPFVIMLMGFVVFILIIKWIAKPLTESYINTLKEIKSYVDVTTKIRDKIVDNTTKLVDNQKEIAETQKIIINFTTTLLKEIKDHINISAREIKDHISKELHKNS